MKKVRVSLKHSKTHCISVGTIVGDNKEIFFEFDKDFLSSPFNLSPLQLRKNAGVMTLKSPAHLAGLWGVFHDSLPDGWGLILMDRYFRKQNMDLFQVSHLDRLLFVGERGSGALVYEPSFSMSGGREKFLDLQKLSNESQKILAGTAKELLPELLKAGGSPAGARPKIFVGLDKENNVISGAEELPTSFEHWIVKFNSPIRKQA